MARRTRFRQAHALRRKERIVFGIGEGDGVDGAEKGVGGGDGLHIGDESGGSDLKAGGRGPLRGGGAGRGGKGLRVRISIPASAEARLLRGRQGSNGGEPFMSVGIVSFGFGGGRARRRRRRRGRCLRRPCAAGAGWGAGAPERAARRQEGATWRCGGGGVCRRGWTREGRRGRRAGAR